MTVMRAAQNTGRSPAGRTPAPLAAYSQHVDVMARTDERRPLNAKQSATPLAAIFHNTEYIPN